MADRENIEKMFGRSQTQEHLKSVGKKYTTKENIEKLM
jgi:hypothetical protein